MRDEVAFLILQNINKGVKTQKYIIKEYVLYSEFVVKGLEAVCVWVLIPSYCLNMRDGEPEQGSFPFRFRLTSLRARFPTLLFSALVYAPSPLIF